MSLDENIMAELAAGTGGTISTTATIWKAASIALPQRWSICLRQICVVDLAVGASRASMKHLGPEILAKGHRHWARQGARLFDRQRTA